ncbi:MAG: McrC family protein [Sandaracinaceae bacterium]|nr:McrC family protein [Sandaracinaceae bacterium]
MPGTVALDEWVAHDLAPAFHLLEKQGIVSVLRSSAAILIKPRNYVGEMHVSGFTLRIVPKSMSMMAGMASLALVSESVREARQLEATIVPSGPSAYDAALAFVDALGTAVRAGFPWDYATIREDTGVPRGKIDFRASVSRFGARGRHHRVVVRRSVRRQHERLVQIVATAHACLPAAPTATAQVLARALTLIGALDSPHRTLSIEEALSSAVELRAEAIERTVIALLEASIALLKRHYATSVHRQLVPSGVATFQSLEDLWERCVCAMVEHTASHAVGCEAEFHGLRGTNVRLFDDGGPALDPDVIVRKNGAIVCVVDAKYRRAADSPDAGDLYQIAAYVSRTNASLGMLVQTGEQSTVRLVGTSQSGAFVLFVTISSELFVSEREGALSSLLEVTP